jgi:hypothetical protein
MRIELKSVTVMQAEAFVPESIVRVGARMSGREGVQSYEVHDKRVRYELS